MSITRQVNWLLFWLLVLVALSIVGTVWMIAFDQNPAMVFSNTPFSVDKTQYHAGDLIFGDVDYCRRTRAPGHRYMSFVGQTIVYLPEEVGSAVPPGCGSVRVQLTAIPNFLPPGKYHLVGRNEYRVNFLATRYVDWSTQEFEVVK